MPPLFLDHSDAKILYDQIEEVRLAIKRARRYTTKLESRQGQACNRALFDAEQGLDQALLKLR